MDGSGGIGTRHPQFRILMIFATPSRRGVASVEQVSSTTVGVDVCENGPNGMISPHGALSRAATRKRLVRENIGGFVETESGLPSAVAENSKIRVLT
jgi:hypothetical protein